MRQIGTLGTIPTITVAGHVFTDLDNLIMITGTTGASPNTLIGLSRVSASPTAYQVTAGKTLTISAVRVNGYGAGPASGSVTYGDNALNAVSASGTPQTNAVNDVTTGYLVAGIGAVLEFVTDFDAPATKYMTGVGELVIIKAFGYEA